MKNLRQLIRSNNGTTGTAIWRIPLPYDYDKPSLWDTATSNKLFFTTAEHNSGFDRVLSAEEGVIGHLIVPGYKEEDISIVVEDDMLKITGKKVYERPEGYELIAGTLSEEDTFEVSYTLYNADVDKISADLKNGILEVKIPYLPKEVKKIDISSK